MVHPPLSARVALLAVRVPLLGVVAVLIASLPLRAVGEDDLPFETAGALEAAGKVRYPALPGPGGEGSNPRVIEGNSAAAYRSIIVPELFPLVRSGALSLNALSALRNSWRRDPKWYEIPQGGARASGGSEEVPSSPAGRFPFGAASDLAAEKNSAIQARKILHNVAANFSEHALLDYDVTMAWFRESKLFRQLQGRASWFYPARSGAQVKGKQEFRERLTLTAPEAIAGLSYLTFRFPGEDPDALWTTSPAISAVRELTESNRSDALLRSPLSLEDLRVWSGKVAHFDVAVDGSTEILIPFDEEERLTLKETSSGCVGVDFNSHSGMSDTIEARIAEGRQGWSLFSSLVVFVPRRVWRIEITPQDPFSLYGRQVLYVDQMTMLPVIKIVFDRSGASRKTIVGAFSLAEGKGGRREFALSYLFIKNAQDDSSLLQWSKTARFCSEMPSDVSLDTFDPRKLIKNTEGEKAKASPTVVVPEGDSDVQEIPED